MKLYVKAPLVLDTGDNEELGRWVLENMPDEWSSEPVAGIDYEQATPFSFPVALHADLSGMYPSAKRRLCHRIASQVELGRDAYSSTELMNEDLYVKLLEAGMSPYKLQELDNERAVSLSIVAAYYGTDAVVELYKEGKDLAELEDLEEYEWLVKLFAETTYSLSHMFTFLCSASATHDLLWDGIPLDDLIL